VEAENAHARRKNEVEVRFMEKLTRPSLDRLNIDRNGRTCVKILALEDLIKTADADPPPGPVAAAKRPVHGRSAAALSSPIRLLRGPGIARAAEPAPEGDSLRYRRSRKPRLPSATIFAI